MRRTYLSTSLQNSGLTCQKRWPVAYNDTNHFSTQPFLHSQTPSLPNLDPNDQKSKKSAVKERIFEKFFNYIKGYDIILEKLLPDVAFKYYKIFSTRV